MMNIWRAVAIVGVWACVTVGAALVSPWLAIAYLAALIATFFLSDRQNT
jgi:hypothetical protein